MYDEVNNCIRCGTRLILKEDREHKERPHCPNCGWIYYKNPIPASACVVINNKNELLLVKRKLAPHAGEWALPSGYIELWQSPEECAVAELEEETGLVGEIVSFIDFYTGYSPIYLRTLSFGFLMKEVGGILQAGDDALEAVFYNQEELPDICFWSHQHFLRKINYIK
ncbi:MAG: NUDIX hydrolase [Candidatus Cloacimonadales bacterium]